MSLVEVGKILELYYSSSNGRVSKKELVLDNDGVVGDKYYNKDVERSVLIATRESYHLASQNKIDVPYGALGENILIDYNPYHLKAGARLQMGKLVLEISQNCTICNSLAKVDARLPELLKEDRGIFAKVVKSGTIHQGDNIYLLDN